MESMPVILSVVIALFVVSNAYVFFMFRSLRAEMQGIRTEFREDLQELREDMRREFDRLALLLQGHGVASKP